MSQHHHSVDVDFIFGCEPGGSRVESMATGNVALHPDPFRPRSSVHILARTPTTIIFRTRPYNMTSRPFSMPLNSRSSGSIAAIVPLFAVVEAIDSRLRGGAASSLCLFTGQGEVRNSSLFRVHLHDRSFSRGHSQQRDGNGIGRFAPFPQRNSEFAVQSPLRSKRCDRRDE